MAPSSPASRQIRFGEFILDLDTAELRKNGYRSTLQGQPFQILQILIERPGILVTRDELKKRLWPSDTFVDFDQGLNKAVKRLREALEDSADHPRLIETLPRRGYRFIGTIREGASNSNEVQGAACTIASTNSIEGTASTRKVAEKRRISTWTILVPLAVLILIPALIMAGLYWHSHRTIKLTDKDTIVLADFTNTTGDPVFDGALRQGLSVQLEQSPFLSIASNQQVQQTLQMMGQKPEAKLTLEIARELCQRTASAAVLEGSIAQIGTPYLLTVRAVNCSNGETLASTEAQAGDKNHVLEALGKTASEIRSKLGESLSTVQKFDTPLAQATTPSLEALQAYSLGLEKNNVADDAGGVPSCYRATSIDPAFAAAYACLAVFYGNMGEQNLAAENSRKAYELRERVSEREKFFIENNYFWNVTGDQEKALRANELWVQTYPRDAAARDNLGVTYVILGQFDKALPELRETVRLHPDPLPYSNLVLSYMVLNRLEEARATVEEAREKKLDSFYLHFLLYRLAFLQNDVSGMLQQVAWSSSQPGVADTLLALEANTVACSGRLEKARTMSGQATSSAERANKKETAASYESDAALREALFGNAAEARHLASEALRRSTGRYVQSQAALALAVAGDVAQAKLLADDLAKRFAEDTLVQFIFLPMIRAQLALNHNDTTKAIEILQTATPYELGSILNFGFASLRPVYVRGAAYLAAHGGVEAAAEFQKIIDHRGLVANEPIASLAHLQLGRAYLMQGDTAKAKAAYQDFLTLWKDADPDIPILKQAKAEYAKLQ